MEYRIFNDWKKKLWSANEAEVFETLLKEFKVWYKDQTFKSDEEKEQLNQQIVDLKEKKTNFFNKQNSRPTITKTNYIFREEEGRAFARLCDALATYFENKV